jgi:6-phosphogluconolactonase (cycloisomerase 2 family)
VTVQTPAVPEPTSDPTGRTDLRLWVGTYPEAGAGTPSGLGEGVWRVRLDPTTGVLSGAVQVAVTPAPSFLAVHPSGRVLYAVGEDARGTVTAFAVPDEAHVATAPAPTAPAAQAEGDPDTLRPLATVASGGADPCHLLLAPDARTLYVANYSSGTLAVVPLAPDGSFAPEVLEVGGPLQVLGHEGTGPDASRQEGPHAHFVALTPDAAHLLVVDLGTDQLRRYRLGPDGRVTDDGVAATFPRGTGPRHLVFSADGRHLYVVGELDVTVHVLAWDAATTTARRVQVLPAGSTPAAPDPVTGAVPRVLPSHVTLDGDRLLVGVRSAGVLVELAVGEDGLLTPVQDVPLPGTWPRHHASAGAWTVVAEQLTGALVPLAPGTRAPGQALALPAAACVVVG